MNKKHNLGNDPVYDARTLGVPRMLLLGLQHAFELLLALRRLPAHGADEDHQLHEEAHRDAELERLGVLRRELAGKPADRQERHGGKRDEQQRPPGEEQAVQRRQMAHHRFQTYRI